MAAERSFSPTPPVPDTRVPGGFHSIAGPGLSSQMELCL